MTGICVVYNTEDLFRRAYESFRRFHPQMQIVIVDGSSPQDSCYDYIASLRRFKANTVYQLGYNIGHGNGMHYALERLQDSEALIFDSDIVMLRSPLSGMAALMDDETYGVGWLTEIGRDGFDYSTYPQHKQERPIRYLHPYFALINVKMYRKFQPFVHHGAPCYKAMIDIHDKGLSAKLLKSFPGLTGHTSGEGVNWKGRPSEFIQHDFGGTRSHNRKIGKKEIEGKWVR